MIDLARITDFEWDDGNPFGKTLDQHALHIAFTLRGDGTLIRVISARDMHRKERSVYDQAR